MKSAAGDADPDASLISYLAARTGLALHQARYRDMAAGLAQLKRRFGIADSTSFIARLRSDTRLFDTVISEITVGETYFMRETAQLDAVRRVILPALTASRPADARLRLWSAGCSTGEEAYSLAMIVEEEGMAHRASILATDISACALSRARRAEYGQWSMRSASEGLIGRYFTLEGKSLRLVDRLRKRVSFQPLNLASDGWPSAATGTEGLDLILCRNVLIYFAEESVRQVAERLYASLAQGGWLITGPSDPPLWRHAPFSSVIAPGAVLYRRDPAARSQAAAVVQPPLANGAGASINTLKVPMLAPARPGQLQGGASGLPGNEAAWLDHVRRLSRLADLSQAERRAAEAVARHPLSVELHYLRSVLLIALDRHDEAVEALGRLLYLDRGLAAAHLTLGTLLQRRGDFKAARRSLESAYRLCAARPPKEAVPLCDGESSAAVAEIAKAEIVRLKDRVQSG